MVRGELADVGIAKAIRQFMQPPLFHWQRLKALAHLRSGVVVANAFLIRIAVPAAVWKLRERVAIETLDASWSVDPPGEATIRFGDAWLTAASSPLLVVPSVIVPEESNVLINPVHPAAAKIKASVERRFLFDGRLRP
jgi:RES domain-containing protein